MDFSLEAYPFTEYLQNLLACIKLVVFAEMNPVMVCGWIFYFIKMWSWRHRENMYGNSRLIKIFSPGLRALQMLLDFAATVAVN